MASLDMQLATDSLPSFRNLISAQPSAPSPEGMNARRHSYGTTSHKQLRHDDPKYYASLKKIFETPDLNERLNETGSTDDSASAPDLDSEPARPRVNTLDFGFDTLAKQTLDELFGDEDDECAEPSKKRYSLGDERTTMPVASSAPYDPLGASHQLDLHAQQFFPPRKVSKENPAPFKPTLMRKAASDNSSVLKAAMQTVDTAKAAAAAAASAKAAQESGMEWLKVLARRKSSVSIGSGDSPSAASAERGILPPAAKPPQGWTPTLQTVVAMLKLRKLHAAKLAREASTLLDSLRETTPEHSATTSPDGSPKALTRQLSRQKSSGANSPPGLTRQLTASEVATAIPFVDKMATPSTQAVPGLEEYGELFDPNSADFDVQAFYEECWVAQAASDPGRNTFLAGAYNEPAPGFTQSPAQPLFAVPTPYGYVMMPLQPELMGMAPAQAQAQMPPPAVQQPPMVHSQFSAPPMAQQQMSAPMMMAPQMAPQMQQMAPMAPMAPMQPMQPMQPAPQMAPPQPPMVAPQVFNGSFNGAFNGSLGAAPQASQFAPPQFGQQPFAQQQPLAQQQPFGGAAPQAPQQWNANAPIATRTRSRAAVGGAAVGGGNPAVVAKGSLAAMAMEQEGSRAIQQRLHAMAPHELLAAIDELAPHLTSLAANPFGNYLVSSMATLPAAHPAIFKALQGHVVRLMAHPQGSRVVQAALERLPPPQVANLVAELEGKVVDVACGTHGSWSVVAAYKHSGAGFVLREIAVEIGRLSVQQNGSRVVQRVLGEAAAAGVDVSECVDALLRMGTTRLAEVAEDRFGNYVVQLAVRHAHAERQQALICTLLPSLRALALSKCGSNVAEVLIELAPPQQLYATAAAISPQEADELRTHPYASYVMTAIDRRM